MRVVKVVFLIYVTTKSKTRIAGTTLSEFRKSVVNIVLSRFSIRARGK